MSEPAHPPRIENLGAAVCLGLIALFHVWGATVAWNNQNLPGCEFRQTQTAISAHFILQEKNYSLAYPTPVLGKPWSIPMEFPLYQWTVAKVAEKTGWPLTQVGRGVSLACFYLTLPALYLLLRRLGLRGSRAVVVLCFVLSCPLYIFYARSFLIETMAWMFGAWFLLGYVCSVEKRGLAWLAVAAVAGAGAGLVKVTTLMAYLLPAFSWTLFWFWTDWRANQGRARLLAWRDRFVWCAVTVAGPFAAAWWWVRYSDHIKAQSPTGAFLQSTGLAGYNFGVGSRFDPAIWSQHWQVIFHEVATIPVLLLAGVAALLFARARWWLIGLLVFYFFAVQLTFPILYAWHEYYYVAIAMLLVIAIGLALCGLLESRLPRWAAWTGIAAVLLGQCWGYYARYYAEQSHWSPGGSELTVALRAVTDPDEVLIIAGNDWSSMVPYYAQRRALMIRRDLESTWQVVEPAFAALKQEKVAALILFDAQRENRALLDRAVRDFGLDPRPAFKWHEADVFLRRQFRSQDMQLVADVPNITVAADGQASPDAQKGREIDMTGWLPRHEARFAMMTPLPWKYFSTFGANPTKYRERNYVWVHPVTRVWFKVPAGKHRLSVTVEFVDGAYDEKLPMGDRSDGVELVVSAQAPGALEKELGRRRINPRDNPRDRGLLTVDFDLTLEEAADVQFAVLPGPAGSSSRDWILLEKLSID
ncbi:MAG: hypothetical protein WDM96_02845 [Lacunisphaera sp.]